MSDSEPTPGTDGSSPRTGRKKQATRARIVDSAIPLFSEAGYDTITMDAIAKAAGVSRANLYLHFSAKAELVAAMLEQLSPEVVKSYRALDSLYASDHDAIREWVETTSILWTRRRKQFETLEHALSVEPLVAQRWYQTLGESADAMVGFLNRHPIGPERDRARLLLITTMLGFERTLYFVFVRSAPSDPAAIIDVVTAQWQAVLTGAVAPSTQPLNSAVRQ